MQDKYPQHEISEVYRHYGVVKMLNYVFITVPHLSPVKCFVIILFTQFCPGATASIQNLRIHFVKKTIL